MSAIGSVEPAHHIPEGFHPLNLGDNPFIALCGPFYGRADGDALVMGLRVQQRHCNPAGSCHGGMLGTLADLLLVLGANVQTGAQRYMVTVNLDCDFLAPAPLGSWLEGRLQVMRATRNLVFCQGQISADGQAVLALSGIAKPVGEPNPRSTLAHYMGLAA